MCTSVPILATEVFENLEIMLNKNGDHQIHKLCYWASCLLRDCSAAVPLVSGSEMAACHCGLNSHTFQEKHLCCPSALRADKKYATRLTFIPSGYFLLGFFWLVLGHMCFNLSLKLGNRIAVFSYILAEISYVLF